MNVVLRGCGRTTNKLVARCTRCLLDVLQAASAAAAAASSAAFCHLGLQPSTPCVYDTASHVLYHCCAAPAAAADSGHMGLQPSSTQLSHLLAAARDSGELKQLPCMALRYTQLAAERGIASAAAALGYAYTTGGVTRHEAELVQSVSRLGTGCAAA